MSKSNNLKKLIKINFFIAETFYAILWFWFHNRLFFFLLKIATVQDYLRHFHVIGVNCSNYVIILKVNCRGHWNFITVKLFLKQYFRYININCLLYYSKFKLCNFTYFMVKIEKMWHNLSLKLNCLFLHKILKCVPTPH